CITEIGENMKKIGILGGTFDPPHLGHLMVASEVKHALQLDEIWFIPTNKPHHKREATHRNTHRLNMLAHAIKDTSYFKVNDIEMKRQGKSYTIDTIQMLQEQYRDNQFYFIIGADMVEYLPKWYRIDDLIELVQFVGVRRKNYELNTNYPVLEVSIPTMEISSADIRNRIQHSKPFKYFVTTSVYHYIKEENLYG